MPGAQLQVPSGAAVVGAGLLVVLVADGDLGSRVGGAGDLRPGAQRYTGQGAGQGRRGQAHGHRTPADGPQHAPGVGEAQRAVPQPGARDGVPGHGQHEGEYAVVPGHPAGDGVRGAASVGGDRAAVAGGVERCAGHPRAPGRGQRQRHALGALRNTRDLDDALPAGCDRRRSPQPTVPCHRGRPGHHEHTHHDAPHHGCCPAVPVHRGRGSLSVSGRRRHSADDSHGGPQGWHARLIHASGSVGPEGARGCVDLRLRHGARPATTTPHPSDKSPPPAQERVTGPATPSCPAPPTRPPAAHCSAAPHRPAARPPCRRGS